MSWPRRPLSSVLRRPVRGLAGLLLVLLGGWIGFWLAERQGLATLRTETNHRLDLFASAVEGMVKRLEHVPATIQLNPEVLALLRTPQQPARVQDVNAYLRRLNAHLGNLAIFVLDQRGIVLASSNSEQVREQGDDSQIGEDLSFRPYFLDALSGRVGRHFAIGARRNEPGYFVSHPIRDGARVVGVAAIKISLDPIEQTWEMLGAPALLADTHQVVILSSQPEWRYTALAELPLERRVDLQLTRLYNNLRIARFPLAVQLSVDDDSQIIEGVLPGGASAPAGRQGSSSGMLVLGRTLNGMDWRLLIFSDLRGVRRQAVVTSLMSAVVAGFVLLLGMYQAQRRRILRQRIESEQLLQRANAELEHKVARRTRVLTETNVRLRKEIAEREQAEQTLRAAQDELVHAAKMAVLGQLASGITHELTQPLGAIRTLSGNASEFLRRGDLKAVAGNLNIVARLADQMGGIIQPLKGFARKTTPVRVATDVAHAVGNALFLYDQRLRKQGVELRNHCEPGAVLAWCDPNRLEQVLINLIGNALDAMQDAPLQVLTLRAGLDPDGRVRICVTDSGSGFDEATRTRLFEPFYTTKAVGAGLGLGLAISRDIVREFGGDIEAESPPPGAGPDDGPDADPDTRHGACFSVLLPAAGEGDAAGAAESPASEPHQPSS